MQTISKPEMKISERDEVIAQSIPLARFLAKRAAVRFDLPSSVVEDISQAALLALVEGFGDYARLCDAISLKAFVYKNLKWGIGDYISHALRPCRSGIIDQHVWSYIHGNRTRTPLQILETRERVNSFVRDGAQWGRNQERRGLKYEAQKAEAVAFARSYRLTGDTATMTA